MRLNQLLSLLTALMITCNASYADGVSSWKDCNIYETTKFKAPEKGRTLIGVGQLYFIEDSLFIQALNQNLPSIFLQPIIVSLVQTTAHEGDHGKVHTYASDHYTILVHETKTHIEAQLISLFHSETLNFKPVTWVCRKHYFRNFENIGKPWTN